MLSLRHAHVDFRSCRQVGCALLGPSRLGCRISLLFPCRTPRQGKSSLAGVHAGRIFCGGAARPPTTGSTNASTIMNGEKGATMIREGAAR
jgi:hypothetical protein